MRAYIFPGQGSQFPGMGKDLYENSARAQAWFEEGNDILGFRITDLMFYGTEEALKETHVTQPAIFLHSIVLAMMEESSWNPDMVAGHSLGEFSALVAIGALSFQDGLRLVQLRAKAMQQACGIQASTMAAVIGLDDFTVEDVCQRVSEVVVPANYNCPDQVVISGTIAGIESACTMLLERGAKRVLKLNVGGAFHSPLMEAARKVLEQAIYSTNFKKPICPIYQNIDAKPHQDPEIIKHNLIAQLTGAVRWSQTIEAMIADGATYFTEIGPGNVLQGLLKKINKNVPISHATIPQ